MKTRIHTNPSFELSVDLVHTRQGVSLKLTTFIPTARTPGDHVKFQATLTVEELTRLRDAIEKVLPKAVAPATV